MKFIAYRVQSIGRIKHSFMSASSWRWGDTVPKVATFDTEEDAQKFCDQKNAATPTDYTSCARTPAEPPTTFSAHADYARQNYYDHYPNGLW
jgi:hypothetical protein